jgi:hypothetical protein
MMPTINRGNKGKIETSMFLEEVRRKRHRHVRTILSSPGLKRLTRRRT